MSDARMSKENIIRDMEQNMMEKLRYIPSKISTMQVAHIEQTLVVDSGMKSDTFNTAYGGVVTKSVAQGVMHYYTQNKQPMAWWIGPSSSAYDDLEENMHEAGFIQDERDVGMFCDLNEYTLRPYPIPEMLTIIECSSDRHFRDFGYVLASIFEPPCEQVKKFYTKISAIPEQSRENLKLFIGYVRDRPVSTAAVFVTDVVGIYDVSTHPAMRKKGFGSAMFYRALKFAQDNGHQKIVLQASEDGLGIYKRFGFKALCEFNVWSNKSQL